MNDADFYDLECPWCGGGVRVSKIEINCRIFRHGVHKVTEHQIGQHLDEAAADVLLSSGQFHGCTKQFFFDGIELYRLVNEQKVDLKRTRDDSETKYDEPTPNSD